jgi:hypothetical protein
MLSKVMRTAFSVTRMESEEILTKFKEIESSLLAKTTL